MARAIQVDEDFDGLVTSVYELTVGEVRDYHARQTHRTEQIAQALHAEAWDELKTLVQDPVSENLMQGISLEDIEQFTDLTREQLAAAYPGQLRAVEQAVRAVNPDFFAMRARMTESLNQYAATRASTPDSSGTS